MTSLSLFLIFLSSLLISTGLTGLLRRYALHKGLMDHPNERSSHTIPTPRGGGLGIVLTFLSAVLLLFLSGLLPAPLFLAIFGGGLLIAAIGWRDDHSSLSATIRLLFHLLAAILCLHQLELFEIYHEYTGSLALTALIYLFALLSIVWLINLYNFMDGIDGLAGSQAFLAAGLGAFLALWTGDPLLARIMLSLAGASLGFLLWNWSPAKIFMGDAGSGFLGYIFALLVFAPTWSLARLSVKPVAMFHGLPPLSWALLTLLLLFIADATMTLLHRMLRRTRWWAPHRCHAYQHASVRHGHLRVTLVYSGVILFGLLPLAWWISASPDSAVRLLPLPFTLLCLVLLRARAGRDPE